MGRGTEFAIYLRKRLRAAREDKKFTQQQVADAIREDLGLPSLSKQAIQQWESFETQPRIDMMASWARAVGLRLTIDLFEPDDLRVNVRVRRELVELVERLDLLSDDDRAEINRLVMRLSRDSTSTA